MLLEDFFCYANSIFTEQYSIHHESVNEKQNKLLRSGALISSLLCMANIPTNKDETFNILSIENSTGMLAFSAAIYMLKHGVKNVYIQLINTASSKEMEVVAGKVKEYFTEAGGRITLSHIESDPICFYKNFGQIFDLAVIDPPFGRYPDKNHPYPEIISKLYSGNAYLSCAYMAIALELLKPNGQLLSITPRTYTAGDYSTGFREYLTKHYSIDTIKIIYEHINLNHQTLLSSILKRKQMTGIYVQHYSLEKQTYLADNLFRAKDLIKNESRNNAIYLPLSFFDLSIIKEIDNLPLSFEDAGYQISTGPIITSQHPSDAIVSGNKSFHKSYGVVPLINLHNIKTLMTHWTGDHPKDKCVDPNCSTIASKLIPNQPYVFLRRINAGFRTHKIAASIYHPYSPFHYITIENHINFISKKVGALKIAEAQYIADFLNSEKCRIYFSCTSGSSQFNAKKLRKLRFPTMREYL